MTSDLSFKNRTQILSLIICSLVHSVESIASRSTGVADVPKQDRHLALNLLLEFSVQKGTLREMLETVMLLFRIWNRERSPLQAREDNRDSTDAVGCSNGEGGGTDALLIGFLRRVEAIDPSVKKVHRLS